MDRRPPARTLRTALEPQGLLCVLNGPLPPLKPSKKDSDLASQSTDFILTNALSERPLQNQNPSRMELFLMNVHEILIHSFVNCTLLWTYVKMV